jgi:hypothetical protein
MPPKGLARQNVNCMFQNLNQKPTCSQGQCAYTSHSQICLLIWYQGRI